MSFLFPKPQMPVMPAIPPVPPPAPIKVASTKVEDKLRADIKRRRGGPATIVTSGAGLTTEPQIATTSLLGTNVTT